MNERFEREPLLITKRNGFFESQMRELHFSEGKYLGENTIIPSRRANKFGADTFVASFIHVKEVQINERSPEDSITKSSRQYIKGK